MKDLFLKERFYFTIVLICVLFLLGMGIPFFYLLGLLTLMTLIILTALDLSLLYRVKAGIDASRQMADRFSNGDENDVEIELKNSFHLKLN